VNTYAHPIRLPQLRGFEFGAGTAAQVGDWTGVQPKPNTANPAAAIAAHSVDPDLIVGFGGGNAPIGFGGNGGASAPMGADG
jgi:hypothetical protein